MNAINENTTFCEIDCNSKTNDNDCRKVKGVEVVFSMILFVSAVFGIWQVSSVAISIATLM